MIYYLRQFFSIFVNKWAIILPARTYEKIS
jgi:hypothetical protein